MYLNQLYEQMVGMVAATGGHEGAVSAILVASAFAAAIAALAGMSPSFVQGLAVGKAVEAIGRQPEAAGSIRGTLIVGLAITETGGIYGLFIAIVLTFINPFVDLYVDAMSRL